jgi:hypothetical protein
VSNLKNVWSRSDQPTSAKNLTLNRLKLEHQENLGRAPREETEIIGFFFLQAVPQLTTCQKEEER